MKKLIVFIAMLACIFVYADGITIPCEYREGVGKGVEEDWKSGVVWGDNGRNLLCWGPEKPGKDDEMSDNVFVGSESKIKGYIIIGRVRGPAIWLDALTRKGFNEVTARMGVKGDKRPDEWLWSFGTPPRKGEPTDEDIGVHCRMICSKKLVTFSVIMEPGKTEYYMRVAWKDYKNLKLLITCIPERKFGMEPKWPYRNANDQRTLNW